MNKTGTRTRITAQRRNLEALRSLVSSVGDSPQPHQLLPVAVFMAFTIEAYTNDLGMRFITDWDERARWQEKIELLHTSIGKKADWGKHPLQFAKSIFKLRDRLAHGKPETIQGPEFDSFSEAWDYVKSSPTPEPDWYKSINRSWLDDAFPKFTQVMEHLALLRGISPSTYMLSHTTLTYPVMKK